MKIMAFLAVQITLIAVVLTGPVYGTGLVGYYPLNGNAHDSSGSGNDGSVFGGAVPGPDRYGVPNAAYRFDGTGYITVPNSASLQLGATYTFAWWFQATAAGGNDWLAMISKESDTPYGNSGPLMLCQPNYTGPLHFDYEHANILVDFNVWYHAALTSDGDSLRAYLNGKQVSSWKWSTIWSYSNTNPVTLAGQYALYRSRNFVGSLDEVRIYNRPLTPVELLSLYTGVTPSTGSLAITISDAEQWGPPAQAARVVLFNGSIEVARATADANSSVTFTNVPAGPGYSYKVFVNTTNPWGESFWGEKQNLTVTGNAVTQDVFTRNAPYMPDVRVFVDKTNEYLPDGGGKLLSPGTRLRVELQIKNPSYPGAEAVTASGGLYWDRDMQSPYDTYQTTPAQSYPVGTTNTAVFYCNAPMMPGDYHLSVSAFASSSRYATTLTDGVAWRSPTFTVAHEMVAFFPLNGSPEDSSGFGNNGVVFGGAVAAADRHGVPQGAYRFDGTGYITVPDSPTLHLGEMYTMAFWFQAIAPGANDWLGMVSKATTSAEANSGPRLMLTQPNFTGPLYFDYDHAHILVEMNYWYHAALTSDGDSLRVYMNGKQVSSWKWSPDWTFSNSNPITLAAQNGTYHQREFPGSLDDVRIFNWPLSNVEMDNLYKAGGTLPGILPPWKYSNTGISHTIIVPLSIHPTIGGLPLSDGDYLGVFFDSSGTLVCAGYEKWTGNADIAVSAFGDDPTTTGKDGFAKNEDFRWKMFRVGNGRVYDAVAAYAPVSGIVTNTSAYASNGISRLQGLAAASVSQSISLRKGWSLVSSYVIPPYPLLDSVFRPVTGDLVIVKNGAQKTYIPSVPLNVIGSWITTEGYQLKMSAPRNLVLMGRQVAPESTTVALPVGWSIMPYLRDTESPITSVLGSMAGDITLVKDQDGRAFIPALGVNAIGNLEPGQAYQIKMSAAHTLPVRVSQTLPRRADAPQSVTTASQTSTSPPWFFSNTGVSHTVVIPANANPTIDATPLAAGDFVGVFYDSSGTSACGGYGEWDGSTAIAIAVFGDDPTTPVKDGFTPGEAMRWKIWRRADGKNIPGQAWYVSLGGLGGVVTDSDKFAANGISALSGLTASTTSVKEGEAPSHFGLNQNYPNPFNPSTTISYSLAKGSRVRLSVMTPLGQEISVLVNENQSAGYHEVRFDAAGLASGVYFYQIRAGEFTQTRRLVLVR